MRQPGKIGALESEQIANRDLDRCIFNVATYGPGYENVHLALLELRERREADERDQAALVLAQSGMVYAKSLANTSLSVCTLAHMAWDAAQAVFERRHEPKTPEPSAEDLKTARAIVEDDCCDKEILRIARILRDRRLSR